MPPAPNCFCTSVTTLNACVASFGAWSCKLQTALSIRASFSLPARPRSGGGGDDLSLTPRMLRVWIFAEAFGCSEFEFSGF